MKKRTEFIFPVGYEKFHKKQVYNFQLNRPYSWGYARKEDMFEAADRLKDFKEWKGILTELAEKAVTENRLINASFYYRAAEFYLLHNDPEKLHIYNKFRDLFNQAFEQDHFERINIPYEKSSLPVIYLTPYREKKGTILLHGGFDSFIEEFYSMMTYFSNSGYEVIGFEGPGQGAALKIHNLPFDIQWEKPVNAILDYFNVNDTTLIGLSMGGYYCLRAAAFEKRIKRVISCGGAIDYNRLPPLFVQWMQNLFATKMRNYANKVGLKQIKKGGIQAWFMGQWMYNAQKEKLMDSYDVYASLNRENQHPELIQQDVLLLSGAKDHFVPIKMHKMQVDALINANSITDKIFTKNDNAENHCQIGNTGLLLKIILEWIISKT
jgi:pimeloyl-ACP methyl ester carboxylesterase